MNKNDMLKHTCSFMLAFRYIIKSIVITAFALSLLKGQYRVTAEYTRSTEQVYSIDEIIDNLLTDGIPQDFDEVSLRSVLRFVAAYEEVITLGYCYNMLVISAYKSLTIIVYVIATANFICSLIMWARGCKEYKIEREILQVI